ncbi:MAG: transposase [Candidatus Latescibacteria bacterium]|nr:transposase [Candidatus Latescibacterota bacterium]
MVTNMKRAQSSFIYKTVYCSRGLSACRFSAQAGRMENFIKNHKTFLYSDRTSCHTFQANHYRVFLHSAAYVLMHSLAQIGLRGTKWTSAQFNTLQIRFLKVAGRVVS